MLVVSGILCRHSHKLAGRLCCMLTIATVAVLQRSRAMLFVLCYCVTYEQLIMITPCARHTRQLLVSSADQNRKLLALVGVRVCYWCVHMFCLVLFCLRHHPSECRALV